MVRKRLVDHNALIQAVEAGLPKQELMQQFGYKTCAASLIMTIFRQKTG